MDVQIHNSATLIAKKINPVSPGDLLLAIGSEVISGYDAD
jgi:hypothetical protein